MCQQNMNSNRCSHALKVIGDEVLKGYTADTNSTFLCHELHQLGSPVKEVAVIQDVVPLIADKVKEFSSKYTHVITSGGIGPTHDDKTFEAIAAAFDEQAVLRPDFKAIVERFFGVQPEGSSVYKLATVPKSADLLFRDDPKTGKPSPYPIVRVKNVTVLPGVPALLRRAFTMVQSDFSSESNVARSRKLYLSSDEVSIAATLQQVEKEFQRDGVAIGSYPSWNHSYYRVKLTVDGLDHDAVDLACNELFKRLPKEHILSYDPEPLTDCVAKFDAFVERLRKEEPDLAAKLEQSARVVNEALATYPGDAVAMSFNGGKDCTVVLHLVYVGLCRTSSAGRQLKAVYFPHASVFPSVDRFIRESVDRYNLDFVHLGPHVRRGLETLKETHPEVEAIFMGSRKTDPRCGHLEALQKTDPDWPEFMRVSPILDWSYHDIWTFLRGLWLPYASLYDKGYTSIGCPDTTVPNPALEYVDRIGVKRHYPAYKLGDGSLERSARL